jgi:hypothetical protein
MTPQQLSTQVYEKLVSLNYARKANYFSEANNTWFNELDQEVKDAIRTFPILYVDGRNDLMEIDNLDGNQQFFIFKNDDGFFLVDTQGYNYPRYITELISFDEEDESQAFEYMDGMIRIANDQIFNSVVRNLVSDLNEEGLFDKSDILSFLQFKLDMAFEAATKKL